MGGWVGGWDVTSDDTAGELGGPVGGGEGGGNDAQVRLGQAFVALQARGGHRQSLAGHVVGQVALEQTYVRVGRDDEKVFLLSYVLLHLLLDLLPPPHQTPPTTIMHTCTCHDQRSGGGRGPTQGTKNAAPGRPSAFHELLEGTHTCCCCCCCCCRRRGGAGGGRYVEEKGAARAVGALLRSLWVLALWLPWFC